jgi:hypothetical protein
MSMMTTPRSLSRSSSSVSPSRSRARSRARSCSGFQRSSRAGLSSRGGAVRRYSPQGESLDQIDLPTAGPTSCAFGGPDLAELFITSRSGQMPPIAAELGIRPEMRDCSDAGAGGVYVCRPGISGAAATPFAG